MKKSFQKGESMLEGILILAVIIVVIVTLPRVNRERGEETRGATITSSSSRLISERSYVVAGSQVRSTSQTHRARVSAGNARYSYQPYEEYIVVSNAGREPLNITGWQLKNGKDKRPYNWGGSLQRFSADIAIIPQATKILSTSGNSFMQDVILERGERAIITTGSVGSRYPYMITSFKENMCTGYLEALPEYSFTPALSRNCPQPSLEPGIENMEPVCRDFIKKLSYCETPTFGGKDRKGENCPGCVNGELVSSHCKAFIEEHFNYQGCIAYHASDPEFSGRTWRIFLGRGWEMWAESYETIELYNQFGQLVDFRNY